MTALPTSSVARSISRCWRGCFGSIHDGSRPPDRDRRRPRRRRPAESLAPGRLDRSRLAGGVTRSPRLRALLGRRAIVTLVSGAAPWLRCTPAVASPRLVVWPRGRSPGSPVDFLAPRLAGRRGRGGTSSGRSRRGSRTVGRDSSDPPRPGRRSGRVGHGGVGGREPHRASWPRAFSSRSPAGAVAYRGFIPRTGSATGRVAASSSRGGPADDLFNLVPAPGRSLAWSPRRRSPRRRRRAFRRCAVITTGGQPTRGVPCRPWPSPRRHARQPGDPVSATPLPAPAEWSAPYPDGTAAASRPPRRRLALTM